MAKIARCETCPLYFERFKEEIETSHKKRITPSKAGRPKQPKTD
jgi:hypothetical protein